MRDNNSYPKLQHFNFESDDNDITFSKSKYVGSCSYDIIKNFIDERIVNGIISPLSDEEQYAVDLMKQLKGTKYDKYVRVDNLYQLKEIIRNAYRYIGPDADYNWIDISPNINSFSGLFQTLDYDINIERFNGDVTRWNTSSIVNMNYAFYGCYRFNRDLSNWDFSNVKYMSGCFDGCCQEFKDQMKQRIDLSQLKTKYKIF